MKIASFNVNSLRARMPIVLGWLEKQQPDVLCLQETKVQDVDFPGDEISDAGYEYVFKGEKKYNGVAIFSKSKIEKLQIGFDDEPKDGPRLIKAKIDGISIINTYVPQGQSPESEKFVYKLNWYERLRKLFDDNFKPDDAVIWVGDLNVAFEAKDVHDPVGLLGSVCFCPEVSEALKKVMDWGFIDVFRKHCSEPGQFTFWDYRMRWAVSRNLGWRLDYIMSTESLAKKCSRCYIDRDPRLAERPSDHTPIIAEFDL